MPARITRTAAGAIEPEVLEAGLRDDGLEPSRWGNAPGDTYGWHSHGYRKVVVCLRGAITFHTRDSGDLELGPGDRLEIDAGTEHSATVGPDGVDCAEAHLS